MQLRHNKTAVARSIGKILTAFILVWGLSVPLIVHSAVVNDQNELSSDTCEVEKHSGVPIYLAALDTPDGPPPCGKDGVCNLAVCSSDPDCPQDLPIDRKEPSTTALDDVIDCSDKQEKDIRAVAWNIADDWSNFKRSVEAETNINLHNCLEGRFSRNGKVKCVHKKKCKDGGKKCKLGFGSGAGQKIKIFKSFFQNVRKMTPPDRRACYAGLMAHEFAHTCERYGESGPEKLAVAAFNYWKGRFAVSATTDAGDCGLLSD